MRCLCDDAGMTDSCTYAATPMTYRLAIFDFDGTLADSFPFFLSVFNTIADRHAFRRIDIEHAGELRHYSVRQMMDHVGLPAWKLPLASKRSWSCSIWAAWR